MHPDKQTRMKKEKSITAEKNRIRQNILEKRNSLTRADIVYRSKKIFVRLKELPEFRNAGTIMFYLSKENEVETRPMITGAIKQNKTVCVPKTDVIKHEIYPVAIKDIQRDLLPGTFGIDEPVLDQKNVIPADKIDLIIVPGIAFDHQGGRLGWGKGFYDKFLARARKAPKIGLAFDAQITEGLPYNDNDIFMDYIITESQIIKIANTEH